MSACISVYVNLISGGILLGLGFVFFNLKRSLPLLGYVGLFLVCLVYINSTQPKPIAPTGYTTLFVQAGRVEKPLLLLDPNHHPRQQPISLQWTAYSNELGYLKMKGPQVTPGGNFGHVPSEGEGLKIWASCKPYTSGDTPSLKKKSIKSPDWQEIFFSQGIVGHCEVVKTFPLTKAPWLNQKINSMNYHLDQILTTYINPKSSGFIRAILLGPRIDLTSEQNDWFKNSGLYHVLSISGMHISIFALFGQILLGFLRFPHKLSYLIIALFLLVYMVLVGHPVSVVRSVVMYLFIGYAFIREKNNQPFHALAWAAVFCLLVLPAQILSLGFQLSFAATFFILYFLPLLQKLPYLSRLPPLLHSPYQLLALSALLVMATGPLLVSSFGQITPVSIVANLAGFYLLPPIMVFSLITLLSAPLPLVPIYMGETVHFLTGLLHHWTKWMSEVPYGTFKMPSLNIAIYVWIYLALLVTFHQKLKIMRKIIFFSLPLAILTFSL